MTDRLLPAIAGRRWTDASKSHLPDNADEPDFLARRNQIAGDIVKIRN
jgi:hypothetical protein